jgi:hypothetical protein
MQPVHATQGTGPMPPNGTVGRLGGIVFCAVCLAAYVGAVVVAALA